MVIRLRSASLASLVLLGGATQADTITVCLDGSCDHVDPVVAVEKATTGDVVEIAAGTYLLERPIPFFARNVVLRGAADVDGRPATVLDAQGLGQVLESMGSDRAARIENVRITGGRAAYGGAVSLSGDHWVFVNCVIRDNRSDARGGAMFLGDGSSATVVGCTISGNLAENPLVATGVGGAVFVSLGSVLTLVDSEISGNTAVLFGGGVAMSSSGALVLDEGSAVCGNVEGQVAGGSVTILEGCVEEFCDCIPPHPADLNGDDIVNGADLGLMLSDWGPCGDCPADLDGDGSVTGADLGMLLVAWG